MVLMQHSMNSNRSAYMDGSWSVTGAFSVVGRLAEILPLLSKWSTFGFRYDDSGTNRWLFCPCGPAMHLAVLPGRNALYLAKGLIEVRLRGESNTESDGKD